MIEIYSLRVVSKMNGRTLLDISHLQLNGSEITGIWGPSGSGKSTLLHCISGLNWVDQSLELNGQIHYCFPHFQKTFDLNKLSLTEVNAFRGQYIFTINQYLQTGWSPVHDISETVFAQIDRLNGLENLSEELAELRLPTDILAKRPHQASGGELQRIQAWIGTKYRCSYWLLDEFTSALDRSNTHIILEKIQSFRSEKKIGAAWISHDESLLSQYAQSLIYLDDGKMIDHFTRSNKKFHYTTVTPSKPVQKAEIFDPILQATALSKSYREKTLFRDLHLSVGKNEIILLNAPSGSGKSTLAKILCGLEKPDDGKILYRDKNIRQLNKPDFKFFQNKVQYLYQDAHAAFNPVLSIRSILHSAKKHALRFNPSKKWSEFLTNRENDFLKDIDLQQFPHQLSGGQAQRLQFLTALYFQPELVLMDEPFASIDSNSALVLQEIVRQLSQHFDMSMIVISHQTEFENLPFTQKWSL